MWPGMPAREENWDQFPYPFVFELTGPKDWPLKERCKRRSVPRSLLNKVTNPGQNEDQKLPALYNWLDREGNAGHSSSMTGGNRGRGKKTNDWPDPLVPKWYFFVWGNLEKNL